MEARERSDPARTVGPAEAVSARPIRAAHPLRRTIAVSDPNTAYWFDWEYDRDHADAGTRSRYGN